MFPEMTTEEIGAEIKRITAIELDECHPSEVALYDKYVAEFNRRSDEG